MVKDLVPIPPDYNGPSIKGTNPLTGFPVYFIPFNPEPGRAKILFILDDDWFYSTDAGKTWEQNSVTIDIRQVDVVVSKYNPDVNLPKF